MRALVSLIAVMSFAVVAMFFAVVSRDTGRSPQEMGVHAAVSAAVQVEGDVVSEVACLICSHAACRNLNVAVHNTTGIDIAVYPRKTRVYSLKLPLVGDNENMRAAFVRVNGSSHCVEGSLLKLPQYGRTRCTGYKS